MKQILLQAFFDLDFYCGCCLCGGSLPVLWRVPGIAPWNAVGPLSTLVVRWRSHHQNRSRKCVSTYVPLDISKLDLFVSTAFAVQTKISRLTANSLHPPQNLGLDNNSVFCGGTVLSFMVVDCFGLFEVPSFLKSYEFVFYGLILLSFLGGYHRLVFYV